MSPALIFLVQALVVVALPVVVLRFSRLKGVVPLVVIQIVVGIALGPSLFGRLAPEYYQLFFNPAALAPLSGIGSVAVLVFGLITGLHLDPETFRGNGRATSIVAVASVVVPAGLGCLVGYWILARHPDELAPGIGPAEFAAAVGICTGVTALPVLGAVLREMDLLGRRIGHLALGIAGINDAALWILLGVLLTAVAGHAAGGAGVIISLVLLPVYLLIMTRVVRPLLGWLVTCRMQNGEVQERALAVVGAVAIASALATEVMGLHYILGAFVAGVVTPEHLRKPILERLQVLTVALLMPFFFMLTGLRTLIDPASPAFLEIFVAATAVAIVGKVGGSAFTARLTGESWPTALGLGALLQTKGLMEVIVLTILLDAGIISANVFAALILMAVVSTALAMPLARVMLAQTTGRRSAGPAALSGRPVTSELDD
jgi:Kef-type K+ transport system membrane component KefB